MSIATMETTLKFEDRQARNVSKPPYYIFIALTSTSAHLDCFVLHSVPICST